MFTTSSGTVLNGRNSSSIKRLSSPGNNTPECASQGEDGDRKVNPGEKITYLYR
jgi:hypothetical protein